jgi:hypothetical protein
LIAIDNGVEDRAMTNNEAVATRDRSPAYPSVPLDIAFARLAEFDAHFKRSAARPEKVGDAWGIKTKAVADRVMAALRYYGLLEYQGAGTKDRSVIVSEEGRKFLRAHQEQVKREVIKAAALRPKQIAKFWSEWGADRPADAACLDALVLKNGFSEGGAREFLKVFDATITFAKLSESDKAPPFEQADEEAPEAAMTPQAHNPAPKPGTPPPLSTTAPLRVIMNGDRLDIQASVDLEGLKKLRTMLEKYQGILEMMQPDSDEAAN